MVVVLGPESLARLAMLVGVILGLAKLGEEAASRLGLPGFVGAILAGMALGGMGLNLVGMDDLNNLSLLLGVGITFTLFLAGVEELSNPKLLKPSGRELIASAAMLTVSTIGVMLYIKLLHGVSFHAALSLAIAISMTSLGPLMKLVVEGGMGVESLPLLRIGLVSEIAAITVFNSIAGGFNPLTAAATIALLAVVLWLGRSWLLHLLHLLEKYLSVHEAPFAFIVALILTASYMAEAMGFNAAITALLLGILTSEYLVRRPAYLERIRAFTFGFLEPLFFAGVGLYAVKPGASEAADIAVMLSIIALSRIAATAVAGTSKPLLLMAKGGVDAAMMLALLQQGSITSRIYTAAITTLILSTTISALQVRPMYGRREVWRIRVRDLPLGRSIVYYREPAIHAANIVAESSAAIVVDEEGRPIGYVVADDLVELDPSLLEKIPTLIISRPEVPVIQADTLVAEVLADPAIVHEPILAVVDEDGRLIGTITPRDILEYIMRRGSGSGRAPHSPRGSD